jgi:hypothetical protein
MDVCSSYEQELSVVVDDEAVPEMTSKADIEDFVEKALEDSCVVVDDCILGCYSPHSRPCPPLLPSMSVVS